MPLKTIYIVRHGFRSDWIVNPSTGTYTTTIPTPTGIPSDPALASHGVDQSHELAKHLLTLKPSFTKIFSSPFYRCIQTLQPLTKLLQSSRADNGDKPSSNSQIKLEPGVSEYFGKARFFHPQSAPLSTLVPLFPGTIDETYTADDMTIAPCKTGETTSEFHDRVAYAMERIIARCDRDGTETILICTHAAIVIAAGRALTGSMKVGDDDYTKNDFNCATCCFSKYTRASEATTGEDLGERCRKDKWDDVPFVDWKNGKGIGGGWKCDVNGDCSHLKDGAERAWSFELEDMRVESKLESSGQIPAV